MTSKNKVCCTRKIEFDAAHRVVGHENKCKFLHGHRYVLEASFKQRENELDEIGRVIDFGSLKKIIGDWIDENWDHNAILWVQDEKLGQLISEETGQKVFYMDENPTCENMVKFLFEKVFVELFEGTNVECDSIKLYETPNCYSVIS